MHYGKNLIAAIFQRIKLSASIKAFRYNYVRQHGEKSDFLVMILLKVSFYDRKKVSRESAQKETFNNVNAYKEFFSSI